MATNTNVNLNPPFVNADGLMVNYGRNEFRDNRGGTIMSYNRNVTSFDIQFAEVALGVDATHNFILSYETYIPKNAIVEKCEFFVTEAWDSTSNDVALNFGLIRMSDYEIIDADGLMDTVAKTVIDAAGNLVVTQVAGSYPDITTYGGAELGSARASNQLVSCFWENHAPSQGRGTLKLYWRANKPA